MDAGRLETYFFLLLLSLVLILAVFVFLPYLNALFLAAVLAVVIKPVYRRLTRWFGGLESVAALLTVFLVLTIVFTPFIIFGMRIFQEATDLYLALMGNDPGWGGALERLENYFRDVAPGISINFSEYLRQFVSWLLQNTAAIFTGLAQVFVTILLSLFGLYYLLKDGEKLESRLIALMPLSRKYSQMIWERLEVMINSVIKGRLLIAVLQGMLAGIGFGIFGVPNPAFWGSVTMFAALVPTVGTSLVIVPAVVYLFLAGGPAAGFGLLIWGTLVVGLIDNFLAPQLIERGTRIHPFLILLSVLGGISLLGPIGFLAGPLVLSILFAILDIYSVLILKRETAE